MKWNSKALECQVLMVVECNFLSLPFLLQILLDVDCSATTYDSPVSSLVQAALDKTKAGIISAPVPVPTNVVDALFSGQDLSSQEKSKTKDKAVNALNATIPDDRTETKEESLSGSLLKFVDAKNASKASLEEAFCRDIDAFSEAFQVGNVL